MFCKYCGAEQADHVQFCANCGQPMAQPSQSPAQPQPQPTLETPQCSAPVTQIPPEYQPLSAWAYFGLSILFSIPIVGFIFLIIFSFNGSNINRRSFARSYWCSLIVVAIILIFLMSIGALGSAAYYFG